MRKEAGKRILLHFGAVDFRCQVFIGHDEVTDVPHEGGLVPFTVDVTDFVKDGDNELVLCVWDPTSLSLGATGKQVFNPFACCYTRMSGVWQTVWAETVPEDYVKGYRVVTDIDRATVRIEVEVEGDGRQMGISVFDADGKKVGEMSRQSASAYSLRIPAPRLWSPEDPHLYTFIVRYGFFRREFKDMVDCLCNFPSIVMWSPFNEDWGCSRASSSPTTRSTGFAVTIRRSVRVERLRGRRFPLGEREGRHTLDDESDLVAPPFRLQVERHDRQCGVRGAS